MTDENEVSKRLTLEDPVDEGMINRLGELQESWSNLAERNTQLDQEKIHILAALKRIDDEKGRLFEQVLIDRGLAPTRHIEIDAKTRLVRLLDEEPKQE